MKSFLISALLVVLSSVGHGQECGRHTEKFFEQGNYIVGGDKVEIADSVVSFQVFKSDEWANDHTWKHVCGGTLLSERWVLTAAHCAKEFRDWGTARVAIGGVNASGVGDVQLIKVRRVVEHPDWASPGGESDIALIELQRGARLNANISPACLKPDNAKIFAEDSCVALGWGRVAESADFSTSLKAVQVELMTSQQCLRAYRNMNGVRVSEKHICAGRMGERGQGICQGDLGGPLFCKSQAGPVLVGVASNGALCGSPQHPGIYVRTDDFIDWIRKITKDDSIGEWFFTPTYPSYTTD